MHGWIATHRKVRDSEIGRDPFLLGCWLMLLLDAEWKPRKLKDGRTLRRGEVLGSVRYWAKEWKCGKTRAADLLRTFEDLGMIRRLRTKGRTQAAIISICNYRAYQDSLCQLADKSADKNADNLKKKQQLTPPLSPPAGGRENRNGRHHRPHRRGWMPPHDYGKETA